MGKIDNSLSIKMNISALLQLMELIATSLITSLFITDFTVHDTGFIHRTKAKIPFIWLVYESGTHLYPLNDRNAIKNLNEIMNLYEIYLKKDFCLYRYDGEKLFPVFPKITHIMIGSELTKNTNNFKNKQLWNK